MALAACSGDKSTTPPIAQPAEQPTTTLTAVPTATRTPSPATPTEQPIATPAAVPAATPTPVPTAMPTVTPGAVPTATPTPVQTATPTPAPTAPPTAVPTATPTPRPTATPTPRPTSTPRPTATPTPTATPVPPYAAVWAGLLNSRWLEANRPALAEAIIALAWVGDGIDGAEEEAVQELVHLAAFHESAFGALMDKAWVGDGLNEREASVVEDLYRAAEHGSEADALRILALPFLETVEPADSAAVSRLAVIASYGRGILSSVADKSWVADGLDESELEVIPRLGWIAGKDEAAAATIAGMPFLEVLEPSDSSAVESLQRLASFRPRDFQQVMSHPTIVQGITDYWAKIVVVLHGASRTNPRLIDVLLDPDRVTLEERVVNLPRAGLTDFSIIRTGPGAARSMDLLEHAAYSAESFMAEPFPAKYVTLLIENAVPNYAAGANFGGVHIAVRPQYDVDDGSRQAEFAGHLIAHEVAHYYWRGNSDWVDEGAADFMASVAEHARTGQPVGVTNAPCGYARTIAELERLAPSQGDEAFTCNYALGERVFVDLYRHFNEDRVRRGLRNLYQLSQAEDEDDTQSGTEVGMSHLKEAFRMGADIAAPVVNVITSRWYDGSEPYDASGRDARPTDPALYTVNGRIDQAYVTTMRDGTPGSSFSAQAANDWVWLYLHYDYAVSEPREVELELVDYFEDGFVFDRRTVSFTAKPEYIGGSWWLQVGISPSERRAEGRYWVYVYHEGRKVAEVEYEVVP